MRKVTWRLVPFLMACYFIAYLDRVNIAFAGPSMMQSLGLTAAAFGGVAGIFFIAYFFFEIPSNLALNRFGARIWISRIMLTWGIISGSQAFVADEFSFYVVRFLLYSGGWVLSRHHLLHDAVVSRLLQGSRRWTVYVCSTSINRDWVPNVWVPPQSSWCAWSGRLAVDLSFRSASGSRDGSSGFLLSDKFAQ
jgi:MFS family permease